ncbi:MAG TPA: VanZ family protein [Bacteroidales bacterium]|nr:VanZ family protein [Bacteroidales bacterium]HRZ50000.1 VanZ family protein [Bacteroidales bacterium]
MLILRALYNREQARKWRCQPIVIAIIAGMVFGAFTEFLQFLIPVNRQASWFDFMADSAGTFVGVAIWLLNPRGHQQKKSILQG